MVKITPDVFFLSRNALQLIPSLDHLGDKDKVSGKCSCLKYDENTSPPDQQVILLSLSPSLPFPLAPPFSLFQSFREIYQSTSVLQMTFQFSTFSLSKHLLMSFLHQALTKCIDSYRKELPRSHLMSLMTISCTSSSD